LIVIDFDCECCAVTIHEGTCSENTEGGGQ
jgi:hypothetical protein